MIESKFNCLVLRNPGDLSVLYCSPTVPRESQGIPGIPGNIKEFQGIPGNGREFQGIGRESLGNFKVEHMTGVKSQFD